MNLFAYGTLMVPEIMRTVCGTEFVSAAAVLENHQRYLVEGEQYPGMLPVAGERVQGVVYFDITSDALARLDVFEGDLYDRLGVTCQVIDSCDDEVYAQTYIIKPEFRRLLTSNIWSYQHFLETGKSLFEDRYGGFQAINNS